MKNKKTWYSAAFNKETDKNEVIIYDQIGLYGVSASQFAVELKQLDPSKRLAVRINSPGGDVFDGIAIYNQLREYKGGVDTIVDGLAASIASVIAMAGETVTMYDTAMMMIHKPWTFTLGDSDQLRKDADLLDKIQDQIRIAYSNKTALTDKELDGIINDETWLSADEAEEYGFATNVIRQEKTDKKKNSITNKILNFGSYETFEKFNQIPSKIAACLVGKVKNNEQEPAIKPEPVIEQTITDPEPEIIPDLQTENNDPSQTNPLEKENTMTPEEIKAAAIKAEKERAAEIRACGKKLNVSSEDVEGAIEKDLSVADASKLFIDKFAAGLTAVPQTERATINVDAQDKFKNLHSQSLNFSAGLLNKEEERKVGIEARRNGGAGSIHGLYRAFLESRGVRNAISLDGHALVKRVQDEMQSTGTGDLPSIFENTINKALDNSMQTARTTFGLWTKTKPVKDFRTFSLAKLSSISDIKEIKENAKFTIGSISDKKETGSITTKGIFMSLSRQAQIDDDLGALTDMGSVLGRGVMTGQNRACYDYLFGAAGVGPTMVEDSKALFHTDHGNLVTSSGAAPSTTTIDAAVLAMMTRPKLKGNPSDKNDYTNVLPRFLLVPAKHKTAAERTVYSPAYPEATYSNGVYNPYAAAGSTPLIVVTEAYLSALDADQWYLAADPMDIETIIRLTLNGNESPIIEQDIGRGTDPTGINFRCYYDYGFMAGDWRGLYANDGD